MMGNGLMYGYHYGMGWMLLGLVFWVAIITGIVLLVLWIARKSGKLHHEPKEESALEILNRRYARGEISKEEYLEMKKEISEQ